MLPNLKTLRAEAKISQQTLADAIHVSQPSINKYENHNIEPELEILMRMADYFGTSVDYIIGHTQERRPIEPTQPSDLNDEETALIEGYRMLTKEQRAYVTLSVRMLRKAKG